MSKWGLEYEMTKGHVKKGKQESRTPFGILRYETKEEKLIYLGSIISLLKVTPVGIGHVV